MEIYRMMVVSTCHISGDTRKLMDAEAVGVVVYPKDKYGWFVVVSEWRDYIEDIPYDLRRCLAYAEEHACEWLCLDCDGPVIPTLQRFE